MTPTSPPDERPALRQTLLAHRLEARRLKRLVVVVLALDLLGAAALWLAVARPWEVSWG